MQVQQHDYVLQAGLIDLETAAAATDRIPVPADSWLAGIMIHSPGVVLDAPVTVEVFKNDAALLTRVLATFTVAQLSGDAGHFFDMQQAEDETGAILTREQRANFLVGDSIEIRAGGEATATGTTAQVTFIMRKSSL